MAEQPSPAQEAGSLSEDRFLNLSPTQEGREGPTREGVRIIKCQRIKRFLKYIFHESEENGCEDWKRTGTVRQSQKTPRLTANGVSKSEMKDSAISVFLGTDERMSLEEQAKKNRGERV